MIAIIGVLVAISIPIFHAQLRKARLAVNQANGRAAFSAAEAAYLDYVAAHGSVPINPDSGDNAVTYTYFPAAGKGILNFKIKGGQWIQGRLDDSNAVKFSTKIDASSWTVGEILSDDIRIGDKIARIWTIHMNPENGEIKGYYCAFPDTDNTDYNKVLQSFANGTESQYE